MQPGLVSGELNGGAAVAFDPVRFLSAVVVYAVLSWFARWVPDNLEIWVQVAAVVVPGVTWYLIRFPADHQPLQLDQRGWLIVAALLSLTGIVLALLHLREGRIPEVASTLFLTVVNAGLIMWAVLRKTG